MMKLKLSTEGIEEGFFSGSYLLGIMSLTKNYRFIWKINTRTGFDFRLNAELEVQLKRKESDYYFSVYQFYQAECELEHYIYHNQYQGEYLLPEFKHLDFLWLMRGNMLCEADAANVQAEIKNIEDIQLVAELTHEKIKNKSNLIF